MKIKDIKSYLEGNFNYYYNKLIGLDNHIEEQIAYRFKKCKYDCIPNKECQHCGCSVPKKLFVKESCNDGERFPDLMSKEEWENYKTKNKINVTN